jgi:tRNA(fMet)-specific endonuclease VapC
MSLYVLDTDHVSLFQRDHPQVTAKVRTTPPDSLAITIITAEEQLRGRLNQVRRAQAGSERVHAYQRLRETITFLSRIHILDYPLEAETEYQILRRQSLRIGTQDLRIAAIARTLNATLVTRNHVDFSQVPGLVLEDWSRA